MKLEDHDPEFQLDHDPHIKAESSRVNTGIFDKRSEK
jgi:hypothetical protein